MNPPYIIDSNILIFLHREKHAFKTADGRDIWEYLIDLAKQNYIKIPQTVLDEIQKGDDALSIWAKENRKELILETKSVIYGSAFRRVTEAYERRANGLTEEELEWIGNQADPYVIAHAIQENGTVVSAELPDNSTGYKNIKIPTICKMLDVPCIQMAAFVWNIASKQNYVS